MKNFALLLVLLALSTYIPRVIPALLIDHMHFSKTARKFLLLLPYTVMTALIFPGILSADSTYVSVGIAGSLCAAACSLLKLPVIATVLASVLACWICRQIGLVF